MEELNTMQSMEQKPKSLGWFWIFITVITTAAIVGGGGWYYMNNKATSEKSKLQTQIDDLNKQVSELKSSSSTPTTPTTTDETANWKTYTNTQYKFSFKYPPTYSLTDDLEKVTNSAPAKKLEIKKSDSALMDLHVNPDGFGPFFPDIRYAMEYTNNKIAITKTNSTSENAQDDSTLVMGNLKVYENSYLFFFRVEGSDSKPVTEFDTILSTFQFTPVK